MILYSLPFKWAADHRRFREQFIDGVNLALLPQDLTIEVLMASLKNGNLGERRNAVAGRRFGVNIIPHTAATTSLGETGPGAPVNLEIDLLARYVARLKEET